MLQIIFTFVTWSFFSNFKSLFFFFFKWYTSVYFISPKISELVLCSTVSKLCLYDHSWPSACKPVTVYGWRTSPCWSQLLLIEQMSTEEHLFLYSRIIILLLLTLRSIGAAQMQEDLTDHCCSCGIHSRLSVYWGILQYNTCRKLNSLNMSCSFLHFGGVLMKSSDYPGQCFWLWTVYIWHDLYQRNECKFLLPVMENTRFNFLG